MSETMEAQETVQFRSRASELRVVLTPEWRKLNDHGEEKTPERAVEFVHGAWNTSNPQEIEELRKHEQFGHDFYEVDIPPIVPEPTEELRLIRQAAMALDSDSLVQIAADEQAGWARPVVLEQAGEALQEVEAMVAESQEHGKE